MSQGYGIYNDGSVYLSEGSSDGSTPTLPVGCYEPGTMGGGMGPPRYFFKKMDIKSDSIIDLPNAAFDKVLKGIKSFLTPKSKERFAELGFIYKRSVLMHGVPGTGKTVIINRIAQEVIKNNGIILFKPDPRNIEAFFSILEKTNPDNFILVIFEEFDSVVHHNELLTLLDGQNQRSNIMYLATTNYIEKIPPRLLRPGRFSTVIEVGLPNHEARAAYLDVKFGNKIENKKEWVSKTEGLTIDELKETVLAVECIGENLTDVIKRLKALHLKDPKINDKSEEEDEEYDDEKDASEVLFSRN